MARPQPAWARENPRVLRFLNYRFLCYRSYNWDFTRNNRTISLKVKTSSAGCRGQHVCGSSKIRVSTKQVLLG